MGGTADYEQFMDPSAETAMTVAGSVAGLNMTGVYAGDDVFGRYDEPSDSQPLLSRSPSHQLGRMNGGTGGTAPASNLSRWVDSVRTASFGLMDALPIVGDAGPEPLDRVMGLPGSGPLYTVGGLARVQEKTGDFGVLSIRTSRMVSDEGSDRGEHGVLISLYV